MLKAAPANVSDLTVKTIDVRSEDVTSKGVCSLGRRPDACSLGRRPDACCSITKFDDRYYICTPWKMVCYSRDNCRLIERFIGMSEDVIFGTQSPPFETHPSRCLILTSHKLGSWECIPDSHWMTPLDSVTVDFEVRKWIRIRFDDVHLVYVLFRMGDQAPPSYVYCDLNSSIVYYIGAHDRGALYFVNVGFTKVITTYIVTPNVKYHTASIHVKKEIETTYPTRAYDFNNTLEIKTSYDVSPLAYAYTDSINNVASCGLVISLFSDNDTLVVDETKGLAGYDVRYLIVHSLRLNILSSYHHSFTSIHLGSDGELYATTDNKLYILDSGMRRWRPRHYRQAVISHKAIVKTMMLINTRILHIPKDILYYMFGWL